MTTRRIAALTLILCCTVAFAEEPRETRTDLARDVYVEMSSTNMPLSVMRLPSRSSLLAYRVDCAATTNGVLLSFVDGKLFEHIVVDIPATNKMSLRGLSAGDHRITVQLIDPHARIGRQSLTVDVKK